MSNVVLSHPNRLKSPSVPGAGPFVAAGFTVWFALIFLLGAGGVFATQRESLPLALLIAVASPVMLFLIGFRVSRSFREFILTADLRFMTGIQAWRIGGFTFLALYTYGLLPGYFALPAGLGDMAIGVTAPWIIVALSRQSGFAASKTFMAWNIFGILDLVVAVSLGALGPRFFASDVAGADATASMAHLPLVFIPAFLVPTFIILHLAALFQAGRLAQEKRS